MGCARSFPINRSQAADFDEVIVVRNPTRHVTGDEVSPCGIDDDVGDVAQRWRWRLHGQRVGPPGAVRDDTKVPGVGRRARSTRGFSSSVGPASQQAAPEQARDPQAVAQPGNELVADECSSHEGEATHVVADPDASTSLSRELRDAQASERQLEAIYEYLQEAHQELQEAHREAAERPVQDASEPLRIQEAEHDLLAQLNGLTQAQNKVHQVRRLLVEARAVTRKVQRQEWEAGEAHQRELSSQLMQRMLCLSGLMPWSASLEDLAAKGIGIDASYCLGGAVCSHVLQQLELRPMDTLLEMGGGFGAFARTIAVQHPGVNVLSLECNHEHAAVAQAVNVWPSVARELQGRVRVVAAAQSCAHWEGIKAQSVDKAVLAHVGVSVKEKVALARQLCRVLRPGARVVLLEPVMPGAPGAPGAPATRNSAQSPMPWSRSSQQESCVCHVRSYQAAFEASGFSTMAICDRAADSQLTQQMLHHLASGPCRQSLGLRLALGNDANAKLDNYRAALASGSIRLAEVVFKRKHVHFDAQVSAHF